jgi:hypothetical protein
MLAGAAVLIVDAAALLTYKFVEFRYWESSGSNESIFELPVLLIALGLLGSLLGLIGAAGSRALGGAAVSVSPGRAGGILPRRVLLLPGVLALGAGAVVALVVIPAVTGGALLPTASARAAKAFTINAILNVLIGILLLAPVSRRNAGAGKVLVVMAGFVGLLLGSALLDAASALMGDSPAMPVAAVACFVCAAGDLGAGVLALVAALRRPGFAEVRCRGVGRL